MTYDVRGKKVTNNSLINLVWYDGDMISGKGEKHEIFTPEQRKNISFNQHKWLGGEVVVSYKGEIIYITLNGLKTNQSTAQNILDAIKSGYTQDVTLLQD